MKMKKVEIDEHDVSVITHALAKRLKDVTAEFNILLHTRNRELSQEEKWQLPANLQMLSRDELQEQINPWRTLQDTITYLIGKFND